MDETFTVARTLQRSPRVYKLEDYDGEPIEGLFYEAELQKVKMTENKMFHVEKILKCHLVRGGKASFYQVEKLAGEIQKLGESLRSSRRVKRPLALIF